MRFIRPNEFEEPNKKLVMLLKKIQYLTNEKLLNSDKMNVG